MFETATLSYGPSGKRIWTTAMGFTGQALLIAGALLAPMISPQVLPRVAWITSIAPPGAPPPPPPAGIEREVPRTKAPVSQIHEGRILIPTRIPTQAQIIVDPEPVLVSGGGGVVGGVDGGVKNGVSGTVLIDILRQAGSIVPVIKPPEPIRHEPVKPAAATVTPPRITSLKMASPIHRVDPIYPVIAKQARVSGVVELLGVLGTDGRIHELKVLRGHPLLVNAAVEAVRQWIYEPAVLNGQAVEVSAPITVTFILNQ
jgi:protein TonB